MLTSPQSTLHPHCNNGLARHSNRPIYHTNLKTLKWTLPNTLSVFNRPPLLSDNGLVALKCGSRSRTIQRLLMFRRLCVQGHWNVGQGHGRLTRLLQFQDLLKVIGM